MMTVNLDDLTPKQIQVMSQIPANGDKISISCLYDTVQQVGWYSNVHIFRYVLKTLTDRKLIEWSSGMVQRADPAP